MTRTRGRDGAHLYSSTRPSLCNCLCASELETSMDVEKRFLSFFLSFFFFLKEAISFIRERNLCSWPCRYNADTHHVASRGRTLHDCC